MEDEYYLQDSRNYVGNDVLFWAKNAQGYTTDLRCAHVYTKQEAVAQHNKRHTDIPWPKSYIDSKIRPAVDMQYIKRVDALAGTGIVLKEYAPVQYHCRGCGKKISKRAYENCTCKYCGDNLP